MASIEESIVADVPVRVAYNQWTQFEEFPRFMDGVKEVRQLDDKRLHWKAVMGGKAKVVTFHRLDDHRTKVMLRSTTTPRGSWRTSATPSASSRCA